VQILIARGEPVPHVVQPVIATTLTVAADEAA
jgi:hypothetical protein